VIVPKSTRSFICRSCDALIKAVKTDAGYSLRLLGKSVEENEEYQALEEQIESLRQEIAEMHRKYEAEALRPTAPGTGRLVIACWLVALAGLVMLFTPLSRPGLWVVIGAFGLIVGLALVRGRLRSARRRVLSAMSAEIEKYAAERDLLQRRAARIKVTS
jgi:Flp pilus assembly protein TadB